MFRSCRSDSVSISGFPRVCGDVPHVNETLTLDEEFSPRMRGCSAQGQHRDRGFRVFPAYAGMFLPLPLLSDQDLGFPRVCGDVPGVYRFSFCPCTFSPRMRGCSDICGYGEVRIEVFPAYAGMFLYWTMCPQQWKRFSPRMRGCSY